MRPVLVIGATGNVGREFVAQFPAVRALVRDPGRAALPTHVEVVAGDLTRPETLDPALDGIEAVFLVWTAPEATFEDALARIARRARRIVFLSAPLKTPHPLWQQPNPLRDRTARFERLIESSGLAWTFLRPGMFMSNALGWWAGPIRAGQVVRWPFLDVPTAPVDPHDIAAVGVRALTEDGHAGAEYVLTGPEALTHREQIAILGEVVGRDLKVEEMAREEFDGIMGPAAGMLWNAWAAAAGHPADRSPVVAQMTKRPARTFRDWASDHAAAFRG